MFSGPRHGAMEFDQAYAGAADWNFPSPTATPTTANFGNQAFQTPKTASFPSHFQDAFTTPQMPSYGTPQQPQYQSVTPIQRPQSSSDTLRSNYYAAVQAQGGGQNMTQSFPAHGAQTGGMWNGGMVQASPAQPGYIQYDPAQMQTPPPTRGTSVKKPQHMPVAFGTPSTIASRRFVSPQQEQYAMPTTMSMPPQQQQQQMMPVQHPVMQFPPEMQQFGNTGPATAPVSTQSRNFWDSQPGSATLGQPIMLDDPFGLNAQHQQVSWSPNPADQLPQYNAQAVNFNTPAMGSFPVQHPHPRPASAASSTLPSSNMSMLHPQTSTSVDPSLVYSSPLRPIVRTNSRTSKVRPTMEEVNSSRRDSVASGASGSSAPSSNTSTSLRRSNTIGAPRPRSANPAESISRSNSITQAPRTASPLKRMGKTPLGPISETKPRASRASVVLTIDENGRARTETTRSVNNSPSKTARERYPGLFDSDSSDDDSDESAEPPSRNASFSFTRGEERRSKVARLDAPIENLEGLSLPRSHSSASVRVNPSRAAIAAAAQLKRQGSARKPATSRSRRNLTTSTSSSSMIDTCPMDYGDQASVGVESTPSLSPEDTGMFASNVPPQVHGTINRSMSYSQPSMDQYSSQWNPQQPSQHSFTAATQQPIHIRCQCGNTNPCGELLVQCKSCTQYQHPSCVGVDPMFGQPPSYTCFLCTRPTSGMRPKRVGRG